MYRRTHKIRSVEIYRHWYQVRLYVKSITEKKKNRKYKSGERNSEIKVKGLRKSEVTLLVYVLEKRDSVKDVHFRQKTCSIVINLTMSLCRHKCPKLSFTLLT